MVVVAVVVVVVVVAGRAVGRCSCSCRCRRRRFRRCGRGRRRHVFVSINCSRSVIVRASGGSGGALGLSCGTRGGARARGRHAPDRRESARSGRREKQGEGESAVRARAFVLLGAVLGRQLGSVRLAFRRVMCVRLCSSERRALFVARRAAPRRAGVAGPASEAPSRRALAGMTLKSRRNKRGGPAFSASSRRRDSLCPTHFLCLSPRGPSGLSPHTHAPLSKSERKRPTTVDTACDSEPLLARGVRHTHSQPAWKAGT